MKFYSLNKKSPKASFEEAVINGIAPDKGLYYPEKIRSLSKSFFDNIDQFDNCEIAYQMIKQFVGDEIPEESLRSIIKDTLNFDFPLVNIEKDTTPYRQPNHGNPVADRQSISSPPLFFNLFLMVAGNFSGNNYPEALKFISHTISFFQSQSLFNHQNTPDLDARINQLTLEIENLDYHALSNLWGMLSGKYLPSVLYKVRLVAFDTGDIKQQVTTIKAPQPSLNNNFPE